LASKRLQKQGLETEGEHRAKNGISGDARLLLFVLPSTFLPH
jgi:hypothetical protein